MLNHFTQTISAISTAKSTAALAIIRVSGDDAINYIEKCIRFPSGIKLSNLESNTCKYCEIISKDGEIIDTGMVTVFRAPHSSTGENVVEISCHGGVFVSSLVLNRTYECGCTPALRGEFTRRAFSNGKLSLTQAENIGNLLYAQSEAEVKISNNNILGKMRDKINEIYNDIVHVVSSIYAEIDFPDEGLEELGKNEVEDGIKNIIKKLEKLEKSYKMGKIIVEGVKTCICGKPNVGKSTLLNLLCREDRAIVTDIKGTTRDVIKESVSCGNSKLILSDTAGIHNSNDTIEKIGIDRAILELDNSEFIILVLDSSSSLDEDDMFVISKVKEKQELNVPVLCVLNKADKGIQIDRNIISSFKNTIELSANNNEYYEELASTIDNILLSNETDLNNDAIITNARQHSNIVKALDFARDAQITLQNGTSFAGISLESALSSLGELDGRSVTIEVVNDIFSRFCVGK